MIVIVVVGVVVGVGGSASRVHTSAARVAEVMAPRDRADEEGMGSSGWNRRLKFPKYWHLEALAGIGAVFIAGMQLAVRRHWLCLGTLVLGLFWLALAYRSLRRRE